MSSSQRQLARSKSSFRRRFDSNTGGHRRSLPTMLQPSCRMVTHYFSQLCTLVGKLHSEFRHLKHYHLLCSFLPLYRSPGHLTTRTVPFHQHSLDHYQFSWAGRTKQRVIVSKPPSASTHGKLTVKLLRPSTAILVGEIHICL